MAGNESLVKVNSALFSAARVAANNHQRSISEQLSLWVALGQLVESKLTNSEISSLINNAAELRVFLHTVKKKIVPRAASTSSRWRCHIKTKNNSAGFHHLSTQRIEVLSMRPLLANLGF